MKLKTFLSPVVVSLLAIPAALASSAKVNTLDLFEDEVGYASTNYFGGETPINCYKKNAALEPTSTAPTFGDKFGIQVSNVSKSGETNVRSVRFIAEVSTLNCAVKFNRTVKSLGNDKKVSDDDEIIKEASSIDVVSAYTSIANGETTFTPTNDHYLVVYTMNNVPEAYWDYYFDVSATLTYLDANETEQTVTSESHKANILGGLYSSNNATITANSDSTNTIAYADSAISNSTALSATLEIPDSTYPAIAVKKVETSSVSTMSFGADVTSIGEAAFSNKVGTNEETNGTGSDYSNYESPYTGLTSVSFGNQATSFGDFAFAGCTNLETITWPTGSNGSPSIGAVGYGTFAGSGITKIDIPDSLTIQAYAFGGCPKLKEVTIYNECLCDNELSDNPSLETVTFSEKINNSLNENSAAAGGLTWLGGMNGADKSSFKNSPAIKTVNVYCKTLADNIWANAFVDCTALETFNTTSSTVLSANMFKNCTSLKTINLTTEATKIDSSTFTDCGSENVMINYTGTLEEFEKICGDGWYTGAKVTVKTSDNSTGTTYNGL